MFTLVLGDKMDLQQHVHSFFSTSHKLNEFGAFLVIIPLALYS